MVAVNILYNDIKSLLFPKICYACDSILTAYEIGLCTKCRHELPETNYHLYNNNPVEKMFYGRVPIEFAAAFLHFSKQNLTQKLIHHLKYKNTPQISSFLGEWYINRLESHDMLRSVDMVIPVPMHSKKFKKRGYNQVHGFAKAIASKTNITLRQDILFKENNNTSQTFKTRLARWSENNAEFAVNEKLDIQNKHFLLVDDVITTGATLENCAKQLLKYPNCKVSILVMAITS
ncbi:ComF family protein [Zhouia sp. PK063]|uniref:ComF family protein n=1 Tax=Zhouia sp. PK063 TaxID=3373602 RepID=UPI00378D2559